MGKTIHWGQFEWDIEKSKRNLIEHGIDLKDAVEAFLDEERIIAQDEAHSQDEDRHFCIGRIGSKIATVRFAYRPGVIRIIGAGFWRKGAKLYAKEKAKRR